MDDLDWYYFYVRHYSLIDIYKITIFVVVK